MPNLKRYTFTISLIGDETIDKHTDELINHLMAQLESLSDGTICEVNTQDQQCRIKIEKHLEWDDLMSMEWEELAEIVGNMGGIKGLNKTQHSKETIAQWVMNKYFRD